MIKAAILTTVLMIPSIALAASGTTKDVYCSDGQKEWKWLPTGQEVEGRFKYLLVEKGRGLYRYFSLAISNADYKQLKNECQNYFPELPYPQPASHFYDAWYTFSVNGKLMAGKNGTKQALNMHDSIDRKLYAQYASDRLTTGRKMRELGMQANRAYANSNLIRY